MSRMLILLLSLAPAVSMAQVSATQKVIQMLTDMSSKCKTEKHDEEVKFAEFQTWCSMESQALKGNIKKAGEEIELLTAEIGKAEEKAVQLGEAIDKLGKDVDGLEQTQKRTKEQRAKDFAAFEEESGDYDESVSALGRAIEVLSKENYDRTGGAVLLELSNQARMPAKARSLIQAFAGMFDEAGSDEAVPEANAYEFQSSSIVDMLKKLEDEFRAKLGECQKAEMNSKAAYNMVMQDLTDSVSNAKKDAEEKSVEKERKVEKAALDKKQRASTTGTKAEDEKTLESMDAECEQKKLSFAEKQQLRVEEIEAINKATEILESPDASGNADKHLSLAQVQSKAAALMQVSRREATEGIRGRVRAFIASEGQRLHSQRLGLLAETLVGNPFGKVKQLIDSMITRLLEEANEDADHEGFCDTEMGKSKVTRKKLSEDIDALSAGVEDGKSTILSLADETAALAKEIEEMQGAMKEATDLRKAEKAKNKETVEDAQAGQTAVAAATAVLKDFYEKASTATGFVQVASQKGPARAFGVKKIPKMGSDEWNALANPNFKGEVDKGHKEGMQTFGEEYQGAQDAAGGVLGLLEVILSDFANLEADTNAAETSSQKSFDDFIIESKKSKHTKERKIEMNSSDKAEAEAKLQEDIADLKSTQDQLLAADRYYEKLVPQCVDKGMTYEEMVAAREAEITSLKEALKILEQSASEDIA